MKNASRITASYTLSADQIEAIRERATRDAAELEAARARAPHLRHYWKNGMLNSQP